MTAARKRIRLGDVVEVRTPRGLAYLQYTSKHPRLGDTIRVLPGLFVERPDPAKLNALAMQEGYFTFYPVGAAVRHQLVEIVATCSVPPNLDSPPLLRRTGAMTPQGKVTSWRITDGTKETLVRRELSAEEKRIPLASIWNHEFLVMRLSEQWLPEHEGGPPSLAPVNSEGPGAPASTKPLRMSHFLYFPRAKDGKAVAAELRRRGFQVENRQGADGVNWLVLVEHSLTAEDEAGLAVREELERLAQQYSGEYDGSETALPK
jgi:hypothetical protein